MNNLKERTVLYAEDESIIRINISQQLEQFFHKVIVAKDGEDALLLYRKEKPDVVILDINMPKRDGLDVARYIRELHKNVPIIMLTAYTESSLLIDAINLNITKYLVKPVSKYKLKEALAEITPESEETSIFFKLSNEYYWDKKEQSLYHNDIKILLTHKEQKLLKLLVQRYQRNTSIEEIIAQVWEDKYIEEVSTDTVKKLVSNLRKKLPNNCLKSVYGSGYVLT